MNQRFHMDIRDLFRFQDGRIVLTGTVREGVKASWSQETLMSSLRDGLLRQFEFIPKWCCRGHRSPSGRRIEPWQLRTIRGLLGTLSRLNPVIWRVICVTKATAT